MNQDQQTYQRATTAALVGFATHVVLTLFIAILGVYADSPAFHAVTWYLLPGLAIWAVLWLLFNQHRHERVESLEAARLADSDAASAAIFDEAGAQLAQSRTRLDNLYKWGLPIVSAATALYLLGLGVFLLYRNMPALQDGGLFENPANPDLNVAFVALLLVTCGLMGFLVSRYVAGMTRVDAWQGLRGGASFLIGNVFLGVLPLLIGTIGLAVGAKSILAVLAVVVPGIMVLLGIEIVLGFVFGLYRPRKADEFVRPAFDSRVLGWLTRPESMGKIFSETLNYQFGFEISRSWFMQLLGKSLVPLCIVCVMIVVGMSSLVIVEPHQQAVVTTNGAFTKIAEPGLNFKLPWPIGRATKYDVNRVHTIRLGSRAHVEEAIDGPILWTNAHVGEGASEQLLVTAPTPNAEDAGRTDSALGEMLGADIDIRFRITDLRQYLGISNPEASAQSPEELLRAIAEQQVTLFFATHDTQTLLTTGRMTSGETIQRRIQEQLDTYQVGLEVVFVSVSGVHPPQDVADQYHQRVNALQEKQTTIQQARQEAAVMLATVAGSREAALEIADQIRQLQALENEAVALRNADNPDADRLAELETLIPEKQASVELLLLESGGNSGQLIMQARADRWSLSLDAQARALRRQSEIRAFHNAPRYYPMRRYLDMLAATITDRPKIFILPAEGAEPNIVLDMPQPAISGPGGR
ncbi:SPFH domain-containing protein [Phycisphaeraceae bacterium D3-23]